MRPAHSVKFPYKTYEVEAYVDSGAFCSIFSLQEAELIGIDYTKGRQEGVTVGDGNIIPVYYHRLPITIGSHSFKANIGFSPKLNVGLNLLGRKDIFERFIVAFDDAKKTITFIPHK